MPSSSLSSGPSISGGVDSNLSKSPEKNQKIQNEAAIIKLMTAKTKKPLNINIKPETIKAIEALNKNCGLIVLKGINQNI